MRLERHLSAIAQTVLGEVTGVPDADPLLRPTQDPAFGDYQLNAAMALSKRLGKKPRDVAEPLAAALGDRPELAAAEVAGPGFVNLRLADPWLGEVLTAMLADDDLGVPPVDQPETIVVDYSSPNVAKQMHVGHLRSTILGAAIVRLLRRVGHRVIADNHLGDWGTQFGLLLAGMRAFGDEAALQGDALTELERVYKAASARAKEDASFAEEARAELKKLQDGDPDNTALWNRFVAATRQTLDRVYARLGVSFDEWLGESAYHDRLPAVVDALLERGLAREDQGAICVFFNELDRAPKPLRKQKEPMIVRKKDGAYLYSTTDIATIELRKERFRADRAVYVVDARQALHFRQLFAVADMLGIDMRLDHVGFGTILGEDGKPLRTRDGGAIKLEDLLDEARDRAAAEMRTRDIDLPPELFDEVAEAVGVGAVKYADLRQNRTSDYQFAWDKLVAFEGNAGPYLQYAHARIHSIFRKGELDLTAARGPLRLEAPEEADLGRALARYPDVVHEAAETYQPHLVSDHLYELARGFSRFYRGCRVLDAPDEETRRSRLGLAALTARQLAGGLDVLGIAALERM